MHIHYFLINETHSKQNLFGIIELKKMIQCRAKENIGIKSKSQILNRNAFFDLEFYFIFSYIWNLKQYVFFSSSERLFTLWITRPTGILFLLSFKWNRYLIYRVFSLLTKSSDVRFDWMSVKQARRGRGMRRYRFCNQWLVRLIQTKLVEWCL